MKPGGKFFPNVMFDEGLSLRDWFAGKALARLVAPGNEAEWVVKAAYGYADAMLAEREKGGKL